MAQIRKHKIQESEQNIQNQSFDEEFKTSVVQSVKYDGQNLQRSIADSMAVKITTNGSITYIAMAAPGTAQNEAKWQVKKIDETNGVVITWADSNSNFDNEATDLTSLTYG